jgi:hypothetical protein
MLTVRDLRCCIKVRFNLAFLSNNPRHNNVATLYEFLTSKLEGDELRAPDVLSPKNMK